MTKQDIVKYVAYRTGVEQKVVATILDEAIENIKTAIANGDNVYIRGLFSISPELRAEKVGRNISKGQQIVIPAHYTPKAKFAIELRKAVRLIPVKK